MSTAIARFFKTEQAQPLPPPEKPARSRFNPLTHIDAVGESLAAGAVQGVAKKLEELLEQKSGDLSHQIESIFYRPPEELYTLTTLLKTALSDQAAVSDVLEIAQLINSLDNESWNKLFQGIRDEQGRSLSLNDEILHTFLNLPHLICKQLENLETDKILAMENFPEIRPVLQESLELLTLLIHKKEGAFVKIEQRLTDPQDGVIGKTIDVMMDRFDQQVNSTPHSSLAAAQSAALQFKTLIKRSAPEQEVYSSALELSQALILLIKKETKAFKILPLSFQDKHFIIHFLVFLKDILSKNAPVYEKLDERASQAIKKLALILTNYHGSHEGFAAKSARIFKEQFVRQAQKIPAAIINQTPSLALPSSHLELAVSQPIVNFKDYLQSALGVLEGFASWASGAAAQKALEKFCACFLTGLTKAKDYAQKKPDYHLALSPLEGLIVDVEEMLKPESRSQPCSSNAMRLVELVKRSFLAFNQHQIFINGWKMPRLGGAEELNRDSIAQFANNIKQLNSDSPASEQLDYKRQIEVEKSAFIQNTSRYAALKMVYESPVLCGLIPKNEDFYYQMLEEAQRVDPVNPVDPQIALKRLFFEKLDTAHADGQISILSKWFSKAAYTITTPILKYFIDLYATRFINLLQDNVERDFKTLANASVDNLTNYLPILNNVFNTVAYKTADVGRIDAMIKEELRKPEAHQRKELDEIYAQFTRVALDQFAPRFAWAAAAGNWLNQKKFVSPSLYQKFVNFCLETAAAIVRWTLYLPQLMINGILIALAKRVLIRNQFVRKMVESVSEPIKAKGGYNHALNCAVYEQLQKISEVIHYALEEKRASRKSRFEPPSFAQREMFRELTTNLLELLSLNHCSSQQELKEAFETTSLSRKLDKYALDKIVDISLQLHNLTLDSICEKDQVNKLIFKFMSRMNKIYSVGSDVPLEEMQAMQAQLHAIHDQLIHQVIDYSLIDYFDTSLDSLKQRSHEFIHSLKEQSQNFCNQAKQLIHDFNTAAVTSMDGSLILLDEMRAHSERFQNARSSAMYGATGENFDSETLKRFDDHSFNLGKLLRPLDVELSRMIVLQKDTQARQKAQSDLKLFDQLWQEVVDQLQTKKFSELTDFTRRLETMERLLDTMPIPPNATVQCIPQLKESILTLRSHAHQWMDSCRAKHAIHLSLDLSVKSSIIQHLIQEKQAEFQSPFEQHPIQEFTKHAQQQLSHLTNAGNIQRLTDKLQEIASCPHLEALNLLKLEFNTLFEAALDYENAQIDNSLSKIGKTFDANQALIQSYIDEAEKMIGNNFAQVNQASTQYESQFNEIQRWAADSVKEIPILNFKISDMHWMEDYAKGIAFPIVKDKLEKLTAFINKGYNRENILLHTFILPMIRM